MGRHEDDPTTVNSSIALLQERFRQLEKVKERREGKELLKLFSEAQTSSSAKRFQPSESSLQPRLVDHQHRPSALHHDSLSLGLNLTNKVVNDNRSPGRGSPAVNLWADGAAATSSTSRNFDNSDVDTSLHL
ncbi:hypothetical protein L6164_029015 [Bauhinia variegata]|uniref:Uncharacterized protein n=1 Tax=Bauhinia variegata TaxID=167791 RepID=A0ACB9L873_BAUVA|nr:hypothetical protein L6164_029015 [Bauhinia variegata]